MYKPPYIMWAIVVVFSILGVVSLVGGFNEGWRGWGPAAFQCIGSAIVCLFAIWSDWDLQRWYRS